MNASKPRLVALAAASMAGGLAVSAGAGHAQTARAACTPGVRTVAGHNARVFCGPARATVRVGTKTLRFSGGECTRGAKWFNLNIGTVVLAARTQPLPYFAVAVGQYLGANPGSPAATKDGTYPKGLVVTRAPGVVADLNGYATTNVKVTLSRHRTAGTFSGTTQFGGVHVSGSFSC